MPLEMLQSKKNIQPCHIFTYMHSHAHTTSLVAQSVKSLTVIPETWVLSLGWEDPLEKEMAIHSSILAWRIPWTEESGRLQSIGSQESDMTERLSACKHPCAHNTHGQTCIYELGLRAKAGPVPALLFASCVTLGKLLCLSGLQLPSL